MSPPAIRVAGLWKRFRLGRGQDTLCEYLLHRLRELRTPRGTPDSHFWALQDVSFEVSPGEAFGVIGPNGAGKSTLLKLLAGVLRPERGRIDVHGRLSALIELGAGFHGDLSGRENIFLSAATLGMPLREVRAQFDDIVEFAGIREFLDMPVKRYSSGMYARLGFAVAVHVRPRVLLVDEVLSVGDRVFRARCMERMRQFLRDGVAIVFVSHDLPAVTAFCERVVLLDRGRMRFCGTAGDAIAQYYEACLDASHATDDAGNPLVRLGRWRLEDEDGRAVSIVQAGQTLNFIFQADFQTDMAQPAFGLSIIRVEDQMTMYETSSDRMGLRFPAVAAGERMQVRFAWRANLPAGQYALGTHVRGCDVMNYTAHRTDAVRIIVQSHDGARGVTNVFAECDAVPVSAPLRGARVVTAGPEYAAT